MVNECDVKKDDQKLSDKETEEGKVGTWRAAGVEGKVLWRAQEFAQFSGHFMIIFDVFNIYIMIVELEFTNLMKNEHFDVKITVTNDENANGPSFQIRQWWLNIVTALR